MSGFIKKMLIVLLTSSANVHTKYKIQNAISYTIQNTIPYKMCILK